MYPAHSDQVPSDCVNMMSEMEGQEWNINILPFYWLN